MVFYKNFQNLSRVHSVFFSSNFVLFDLRNCSCYDMRIRFRIGGNIVDIIFYLLIAVAIIVLLTLITSYICFRMAFYASRKEDESTEEYPIPDGEIYESHRDIMVGWMKEARKLHCEEFDITSFDGLNLHAKYYEYAPDAPMEIMFHGYRGSAERDLCGGIQRCFSLGRSVLLVDQRTSCKSDGNVISFGINESKDCLAWIDFAIQHFGPDVKIILTGISMGASTVIMAAGNDLPKNVVGVLADCGYNSAKDIIKKVIRQMRLPADLLYPFVKLGAKIFGKFELEENSPEEAIKSCKVPIILFHGESDDFVPCEMSKLNYEACSAPKRLITVPGAGHGLGYLVDPERYLKAVSEFFTENGVPTEVTK